MVVICMNKKGFTLVELLAVISLLGIVGLISVPIISNTLKNSSKNAFKQTLNSIIDAGKNYNAENNYENFPMRTVPSELISQRNSALRNAPSLQIRLTPDV